MTTLTKPTPTPMAKPATRSRLDETNLMSDERLAQGYVIVLPGIEGFSRWNRGIRKGLVDAGLPYGIEIHDWTYGFHWYFWNLRDGRRHREQAKVLADKIVRYRESHPTQPVYVIGHSGGGAMTAFTLAELPVGTTVTAGIMMVPALSPGFDLAPTLRGTERGLWNYSSFGDVFFVGVGTLVCGTCDGRHTPAAGMLGFRSPSTEQKEAAQTNGHSPVLHEMRYRPAMAKQFNFGGHLSCVNPRFIRDWVAPLMTNSDSSSTPSEFPSAG